MQKSSPENKSRRPWALWAVTAALLAGVLGWYALDGRAHEAHSQPLDTASIAGAGPLDINTATADELDGLPGIGPALAQRIIDRRETAGPFRGEEDLLAVEGIGPATYEDLTPYIGFSS